MLSDLFQSKNAAAALILVLVGLLLATLLPAVTAFPGWAAGFVGLCLGAMAGVLVMQGKGANRDELLAIRTGIKTAQRGERASRPVGLSEDLLEVFGAVDDLAVELSSHKQRQREQELALDKLRNEALSRRDQFSEADHELSRVAHSLTDGLAEQATAVDQAMASIQKWSDVDALSLALGDTAPAMNELRASIDRAEGHATETLRLTEQVEGDAGRGVEAISRAQHEMQRTGETLAEIEQAISAVGERIEALVNGLHRIDEVTEQKALIALNLAIIAAQAGEHGRGFSVVAAELKELVERSLVSQREVIVWVKALEEQKRRAEHSVQRGVTNIERGSEVSAEAESALKRIQEAVRAASQHLERNQPEERERVRHATSGMAGVEQALRNQGRVNEEVALVVERIHESTREQERRLAGLTSVSERLHRLKQPNGD